MSILNPGDYVIINPRHENSELIKNQLCRFLSYYPVEPDLTQPSNLHRVLLQTIVKDENNSLRVNDNKVVLDQDEVRKIEDPATVLIIERLIREAADDSGEGFKSGDIVSITDPMHPAYGRLASVCGYFDEGEHAGHYRVCVMKPINPNTGYGGSEDYYISRTQGIVIPEIDYIFCHNKIEAARAKSNPDDIGAFRLFLEHYLPEEKVTEIAERVFEKSLEDDIEKMLGNTYRFNRGHLLDRVITKICGNYVDKFERECAPRMMKRFEDIIASDVDGYSERNFYSDMKERLLNMSEKYIAEHPDEFKALIWPRMEQCSKNLNEYSIRKAITDVLNIDEILKKIIESSMEQQQSAQES